MYGYDGLVLHGWANAGGAEFGGEIEYPYRKYTGAPMVKKNPVQNEDDAWSLRVPDDILSVGTIPIAHEFSRLQYEAGMNPTIQIGSPLTWAGSVCGEERLMRWIIKKPDLVHHVLRVITDFILAKVDLWVKEFGPERMMAFDLCIETNVLYSPKQFETFAFPYLKEIHAKVTAMEVAIVRATSVVTRPRTCRTGLSSTSASAAWSAWGARSRCPRHGRPFQATSSWATSTPSRCRRARPSRCWSCARAASLRARTIPRATPS